jgi:DNA-binding NtrC family response regulator
MKSLEQIAQGMLADGLSLRNIRNAVSTVVIRQALERANGNHCKAARRLGIHRNTLTREIHRLHLEPPPKKPNRRHVQGVSSEIRRRVWGADWQRAS